MNVPTAVEDLPIIASAAEPAHSSSREEWVNCGDPWLAFDLLDPIGNAATASDAQPRP